VVIEFRASIGPSRGVLVGVVFGAKAFSIRASKEEYGGGIEGFLELKSAGMLRAMGSFQRRCPRKVEKLGSEDDHEGWK